MSFCIYRRCRISKCIYIVREVGVREGTQNMPPQVYKYGAYIFENAPIDLNFFRSLLLLAKSSKIIRLELRPYKTESGTERYVNVFSYNFFWFRRKRIFLNFDKVESKFVTIPATSCSGFFPINRRATETRPTKAFIRVRRLPSFIAVE